MLFLPNKVLFFVFFVLFFFGGGVLGVVLLLRLHAYHNAVDVEMCTESVVRMMLRGAVCGA